MLGKVLKDAGYKLEKRVSDTEETAVERFEMTRPNELWTMDVKEFWVHDLKLRLIDIIDDDSRFIVGYRLFRQTTPQEAISVLKKAIAGHGKPERVLSDRGPEFHSWKGTSAFTRVLEGEIAAYFERSRMGIGGLMYARSHGFHRNTIRRTGDAPLAPGSRTARSPSARPHAAPGGRGPGGGRVSPGLPGALGRSYPGDDSTYFTVASIQIHMVGAMEAFSRMALGAEVFVHETAETSVAVVSSVLQRIPELASVVRDRGTPYLIELVNDFLVGCEKLLANRCASLLADRQGGARALVGNAQAVASTSRP